MLNISHSGGSLATFGAFKEILPSNVSCAVDLIDLAAEPLFDVEEKLIANAGVARRAEFRAGRTLARHALRELGKSDLAIPAGRDRRPLWPADVVGSITHSDTLAAAAVALATEYCGLGIDLECSTPLDANLRSIIARPEELDELDNPLVTKNGIIDRAKLIFLIKEAVFKAVYPATLFWLDFKDARVTLNGCGSRFEAVLIGVPPMPGHSIIPDRFTLVSVMCLS